MSFIINYLPNRLSQSLIACYFTIKAWQTVGFRGTHSKPKLTNMSEMIVKILPALEDNYMYLLIDKSSNDATIVDPVAPDTVLQAIAEHKVNLTSVLTTHHHWDHAGGNEKFVSTFEQQNKGVKLNVYGGDDRIGALTHKIKQDDVINVGALKIRCLFTPCHTKGHICYFVESPNGDTSVFTGDTLFLGGCGRFFEGTAEQMHAALMVKLSNLPDKTNVYCGHEYTLQNLAFGLHVEPNNEDIRKKIEWAKQQREQQQPTIPSTIAEEKLINPFMRVNQQSVKDHSGTIDDIETMAAIRKEKDSFKAKI